MPFVLELEIGDVCVLGVVRSLPFQVLPSRFPICRPLSVFYEKSLDPILVRSSAVFHVQLMLGLQDRNSLQQRSRFRIPFFFTLDHPFDLVLMSLFQVFYLILLSLFKPSISDLCSVLRNTIRFNNSPCHFGEDLFFDCVRGSTEKIAAMSRSVASRVSSYGD